jgi:hypothetical protein
VGEFLYIVCIKDVRGKAFILGVYNPVCEIRPILEVIKGQIVSRGFLVSGKFV